MKYLIINADDFGMSKVFNTRILELMKAELISSTSVLVNRINEGQDDQIKELLVLVKSHKINAGLHLEFSDNNFGPEIEKQYEKFFSVFGFYPSHIDLHKSNYLKESYPVIMQFCKERDIPCRNHNALNGTQMSFAELKNSIENFKDGECYELFFHPGTYDPDCKSSLNKEREEDAKKIVAINPFLKENNIKLISYNSHGKYQT